MNIVSYVFPSGASFLIDECGRLVASAKIVDDVILVQNLDPSGYSTIKFADHQGVPHLIIGHGNSQSGVPNESYVMAANQGAVPRDLTFCAFTDAKHDRIRITGKGSVVVGEGALPVDAADGFLYIPTCDGAPTGTPTEFAGRTPIVFDSSSGKLCVYSGGSWATFSPET